MSSLWEQSSMPTVPNGAQSINLVSKLEQESLSNQVRVELDAENLHKNKVVTITVY